MEDYCVLAMTAKTLLTGGTNGTEPRLIRRRSISLKASFNTLGCPSDDSTTIKLYINYTKRLRDEVGAKFQTVIFNLDSNEKLADYEGVIEIGSKVTDYDSSISGLGQYGLVYWMTGASAGCAVNKSNTNKKYDGELTVDVDRTQAELEAAIGWSFDVPQRQRRRPHSPRTSTPDYCLRHRRATSLSRTRLSASATRLRTIRRSSSTRYLGTVPNDAAGRIALWNDICKLHQDLESIRAIEDFRPRQRNRGAGRHEEGCPLHCEGPERRERYGSALI
ncbi:MAG: phage tail sheath subtilisin-like domain-containing protein [Oscillospiraceae bacterium]